MLNHSYAKLNNIVSEAKPILEKKLPNEAEALINTTKQKLAEEALTVQLYGSYNAGKSSFINLLLGQDVAQVGDHPVTDRVDTYDWDGIKLLDSPGVNAPIEHEEVTMDRLKSVDLVVFMIRHGDHDSKDIYRRLVELLESGKQVFVIINYQGLNPKHSDESGTAFIANYVSDKIHEYIQLSGIDLSASLSSQLKIIPLNIKTATKGFREGKDALVEYSGYLSFESSFNTWIDTLNNEQLLVEGAKKFIANQIFAPLFQTLLASSTRSDLEQQQMALAKLENDERRLIALAKNEIRLIANNNKSVLQNGFEGIQSNQQLEGILEKYFAQSSKEFIQWLENQLSESVFVETLYQTTDANLFEDASAFKETMDSVLGMSVSYLKSNPKIIESAAKSALQGVKKYLPELMKGKGKAWIGKVAGKAAPVLQVATVVYDMYSANSEQEKANKAVQNRAYQQGQLIEDIKQQFITNISSQAENIIHDIYSRMIDSIMEQMNLLDKMAKVEASDIELLTALKMKLEQIN